MRAELTQSHHGGISRRTALGYCAGSLLCLPCAAADDDSNSSTAATTSKKTLSPKAPATTAQPLDALLEEVRAEFDLPALAAATVTPAGMQESGSAGVRKLGDNTPVTHHDQWHLGSCTKAMTATMIATLVNDGKLHWDSKLLDCFPELSGKVPADFCRITLTQLLTHRSGLPANGPWHDLGAKRTTTQQRRRLLDNMLARGLEHPPGTKLVYSNVGYALAGLMAETVTEQAWEELMRERLFQPLKMQSVGFGIPGTPGRVDQPWGHHSTLLGLGPLKAVQLDNAASLGPAGTVHASLLSWGQFLAAHLAADPGLLPAEIWDTLHRPCKPIHTADSSAADKSQANDYAMGWVVVDRPWAHGEDAQGLALTHNGSNTVNHCVCWLAPQRQFGIMACTNTGQANAPGALDKTVSQLLLKQLAEPAQPSSTP